MAWLLTQICCQFKYSYSSWIKGKRGVGIYVILKETFATSINVLTSKLMSQFCHCHWFYFSKTFQKQIFFRFNFIETHHFIYQVLLFKRRWFCNDISCFQFASLEVTKESTRSMTRKSRVYRAFKTRLMTKKKTTLPDSLFVASALLKISHCCLPWPWTDTDHKSSVISLLRSILVVRLCYRMFYLD